MELKITNEQQNPLFNRKEVFATVKSETIPTKDAVADALAEKYKVDKTALRVLDVQGNFGSQEFTVRSNIYSSKEERDKVEALTKKEKEAEAKAAEEAAKPVEEPAAEEAAPAETEAPTTEPAAEEKPAEEPTQEEKPAEETKQEEAKE